MNAPSDTTPCCAAPAAGVPAAQIDASARLPLFTLFGGAACWLVLSSIFGLIGSIKFHNPKFLADCSVLTYGRVYPAWSNLLVYGFCTVPAGLGVNLWLLARLGRVRVARPWLVAAAAKLWNFGVFLGVVGILRGGSTGYEWVEMPRYAAAILFVAFLLIAICGFLTHGEREEGELYPSQWFALAALFWFPWIFSTAGILLQLYPVRGVVQASIAWWFAGNLLVVWLGLSGLAAGLYFLPKILGRPLQSRHLALFVFLTLVFFGTWTGIPAGAALPAWMTMLSAGATLLLFVPMLGVAAIVRKTVCGAEMSPKGGPLCFTISGLWMLVVSGLALALTGFTRVSHVTAFTWYGTGQIYLYLYGFFTMIMFGAAYYILPRVAGLEFPLAGLRKAHLFCGGLGAVLLSLPLLCGGIVQGLKLRDPNVPFLDITRSALMFLRIATLGEALIALGALLFLLNVLALIAAYYRALACKTLTEVTTPFEAAGVKA